jgi:hypothetical protein
MNKIDYSKLYNYSSGPSTKYFCASLETDFDTTLGILRGNTKANENLIARQSSGTLLPSSVIYTGPCSPIIVHESLIQEFDAHGVTGWVAFEIELINKKNEHFNRYFGITITGRCNPIDYSRSEVVYRRFPGGDFPYFKGRYFYNDVWDGNDFFMEHPDEFGFTGFQYCTNKVKEILDKYKVKSILLKSLDQSEIDKGTVLLKRSNLR